MKYYYRYYNFHLLKVYLRPGDIVYADHSDEHIEWLCNIRNAKLNIVLDPVSQSDITPNEVYPFPPIEHIDANKLKYSEEAVKWFREGIDIWDENGLEIVNEFPDGEHVYLESGKLYQYCSNSCNDIYRRGAIHKLLNTTLIDRNTVITGCDLNTTVIFSDGRKSEDIAKQCIGAKIIYDRTDNWNELSAGCEDYLLNNADIVTASHPNLGSNYIPNGIWKSNYNKQKHIKKACYIGNNANKVDWDFLYELANNNPNWTFVIVGDIRGKDLPNIEYHSLMTEDECMNLIADCSVGLIIHKDDAYSNAQFNLKLLKYYEDDKHVLISNNNKTMLELGAIKIDSDTDLDSYLGYNTSHINVDDYTWDKQVDKLKNVWFPIKNIDIYDIDKTTVFKWRPSLACNYHCSYCIQRHAKKDCLSLEEIDKVAKQIANLIDIYYTKHPNKELKLGLIGGEPSIYPLDKYVVQWNEACKKHNKHMPITIMTNFSLHDADWWDNLTQSNISILLNASLHTSQVKSIDEFFDKAKSLTKTRIFVKFVATDSNLAEIKPLVERAKSLGLKVTIDAERTPDTQDVIANQEAVQFANDNSVRFIKLNNRPVSRNELIEECHKSGIKDCECYHRLYIAGNQIISGCKWLEKTYSVYDLNDLFWVKTNCNKFNICSYCNAARITNQQYDNNT